MTDVRRYSTRERPRFLTGLLGGIAFPWVGRPVTASSERPDIVVMVMNDARDGDQEALPRTMAQLAANGTTFPNFFLTTPLCGPSRASILTGLYAHNHGVHDNRDGWEGFAALGNRTRTTGAILRAAGYRTAAIGTYLNGPQPGTGLEPGWDVGPRASGVANGGNAKKSKKKGNKGMGGRGGATRDTVGYSLVDYAAILLGEASQEAARSKKKGKGKKNAKKKRKSTRGVSYDDWSTAAVAASVVAETPVSHPLFLQVGFGAPHVPVEPGPNYAGRYAGAEIARDPSFDEADTSDKPRYIQNLRELQTSDEAWLDDLHRGRLEVMLALDDAIALLWQALETRGRLNNTYVFLMTDNGHLIGHHRFYGKIAPYDGSARMPLYAYGPGFARGVVDERLVANIDIAPTVLQIAGVGGQPMDGRSLLTGHDRDAIVLELLGDGLQSMNWPGPRTGVPRYAGLRTRDHLYVEYETGERELYDYEEDPYEIQNLLAGTPSPEANTIASQLSARLSALRTCGGGGCS